MRHLVAIAFDEDGELEWLGPVNFTKLFEVGVVRAQGLAQREIMSFEHVDLESLEIGPEPNETIFGIPRKIGDGGRRDHERNSELVDRRLDRALEPERQRLARVDVLRAEAGAVNRGGTSAEDDQGSRDLQMTIDRLEHELDLVERELA
ncbi:MAG: hypothetical protein NT062_09380 [Proteobacteria bacterium]|nr:hypothetical protein [Pseudomonadota bacterium]